LFRPWTLFLSQTPFVETNPPKKLEFDKDKSTENVEFIDLSIGRSLGRTPKDGLRSTVRVGIIALQWEQKDKGSENKEVPCGGNG
jgi:hypothetical protein